MMSGTANRDDKKNSSAVIIVATILTGVGVLYFFWNAVSQSPAPDSGRLWLIYLFALPLLGQLVSYIGVYFKARSDKSVQTFYFFCLVTNLIATLSYCYLWARYTDGDYNRDGYSFVALVVIHVLLLPVGLMTYLIMWTPNKGESLPDSELRDEEIKWDHVLGKVKEGIGRPKPSPCHAVVERIHWGARDAFGAADAASLAPEMRGRLVAELNSIIADPDFYDERYFHGVELRDEARELLSRRRRSLTDREVQRLNRMLLEACLGEFTKKKENGEGVAEENAWRQWLKKRWHTLVMWWENALADLKDGCAKCPFWAVIFFFTVFLSITYLFAFAFAFHDKHLTTPPPAAGNGGTQTQAAPDGKGAHALYMSKSPPAGEQTAAAPAASPAQSAPYTFYFAPDSAVMSYKREAFDDSEVAYKNDKVKSEQWRAKKNYERFDQLISDIKQKTEDGKAVRVRVVGSTDAERVNEANYASNYELSEARAQNVKYILMGELSKEDHPRRDIEWLCLARSTELPRPPPKQQDGGGAETPPARDGMRHARTEPALPDGESQAKWKRLDTLRGEVYKNLSQHREYLDPSFTQIETLITRNKLSPYEADDLLNKIQKVMERAGALAGQAGQPRQEITSLAEAKDLEESLATAKAYAVYVDEGSRKRVVEVTVEPVKIDHQLGPLKLKDYAASQEPNSLSLLDYVYFTVYTITTTGYGDIVPVTPRAKYLCSLANILEVFFLVVFFNALLSVRGSSRLRQRPSG